MSEVAAPNSKRDETEEERRARKERERAERKAKEKESERQQSGAEGEKTERKSKRDETEEERRARKERERAERKAKEKESERQQSGAEGEKTERKSKRDETEEERRARKERERAERKAKEKESEMQRQTQSGGKENVVLDDGEGGKKPRKSFVRDNEMGMDVDMLTSSGGHGEIPVTAVPGVEGLVENLAAEVDTEHSTIRRMKDTTSEAARHDEQRRVVEDREKEALARREQRRKEREEKKNRRSNPADVAEVVVGTSSLGVADLQRQGYRNQFEKDMQRATALRRLVDMDSISAVLVDFPPQSLYDMYIKSFGNTGRQQTGIQTPPEESRTDVEVQAERVRMRHRGVEVPRDLGLYPEQYADHPGRLFSGAAVDDDNQNDRGTLGNVAPSQMVDSTLLEGFLSRVFPVMRAILDENDEEGTGLEAAKSRSETRFSSSYTTFCFNGTINRAVTKVLFNPCTPSYIVVLHGMREGVECASKELDRYMSVILIWNIYDSSEPEKVLVSTSLLTCICISPRRPYLLYGGAEDGSLCVWDLREPDRNHITSGQSEHHVFRLPSFTTSWHSGNHSASIVSVAIAGYNAAVGVRKCESEQLVSLDAAGDTFFWVVNEKDQSKSAISDTDHGVNMFSTVRLFFATSRKGDCISSLSVEQAAFALDFVPSDPSHYVVACAEGIRHISRFGSVAAPSVYGPSSHFFDRLMAVPSCVRYSTVDSRILMVGYDDGGIRLFLHADGVPQLFIPLSIHRITELRCSAKEKWLVWVLDASGTLYLLDLAQRNKELPVFSETLAQPDTGLCTCFDIPPGGEGKTRLLVVGFEKGVVQLHVLNNGVQLPNSDRDEHWL